MSISKSEAGKLGRLKSAPIFQKQFENRISEYNLNPKRCPSCKNVIAYEKRRNNYCSQSCAASINNVKFQKRFSNFGTRQCKNCDNNLYSYQEYYCSNNCRRYFECKEIIEKINNNEKVHIPQLKKYLVNKHGNKCMNPNCTWDFSKLVVNVELEHIDGNSENNSLENITLLCPNCHSLTSTYKGKNKGNGRYKRRERYKNGKSY